MRATFRAFAALLAGASLLAVGAAPARSATDLCPMGGTLILVETHRDKALAWAKNRLRADVSDAGPTEWSVLTLSVADEGIAVLVSPGQVFFGVAGRGGETYPRDIERAFGTGFAKLRDAVKATLADLVAAGTLTLGPDDLQSVAGAIGLGVLEKGRGGWALTTRDCQAVDLPTSGL